MSKDKWRGAWLNAESGPKYGDLLYRRAIGELPEMQSSIAAAKRVSGKVREGDRILDVGCGSGHYLVSLRKQINCSFEYVGADATPEYVERARKAFPDIKFVQADIFNLPFSDNEFDIVLCNNVLLHLPSISRPLEELARVAKRIVQVRTMIGNRSFRIQACDEEATSNFDADGELRKFHYFNIYSKDVVRGMLEGLPGVESVSIEADQDFDPKAIEAAKSDTRKSNATSMIGDWQVNGYILEPWSFLTIKKQGSD